MQNSTSKYNIKPVHILQNINFSNQMVYQETYVALCTGMLTLVCGKQSRSMYSVLYLNIICCIFIFQEL